MHVRAGILLSCLLLVPAASAAPAGVACPAPGTWQDREGRPITERDALAAAGRARFVLLGESHAEPSHHRFQAGVVAALADRGPVVVGLEMLPRESQPALDRLSAAAVSLEDFRRESDWDRLWGHDFDAYRPLLALIRARRLPAAALNIDRAFVRAVGREGFVKAAAGGAAPVGQPAPAPAPYRAMLEDVFRAHAREASPAAVEAFIEAQTTWDRAMAEALVAAAARHPGAIAIGIMGRGHVEDGHGVAHQLRALGQDAIWSALPGPPCGGADALFAVAEAEPGAAQR